MRRSLRLLGVAAVALLLCLGLAANVLAAGSQATLNLTVYVDANGNGEQDGAESGIAGSQVTITGADGQTLTQMTLGLDALAVGDLPAGELTVTLTAPEGYAVSGQAQQTVTAKEGETAEFSFGLRSLAEPTVAAAAQPARTGRSGLASVSGILVALVALLLPIGARLLTQR